MTDEHITNRLEIYINEQRADLELLRLITQICLVQFLDTIPHGRDLDYLNDFENEIVSTLKTSYMHPNTNESRFCELMLIRAEKFFLAIRKSRGYPARNMGDDPMRN
jgi:hypothetical protein